MQQAVQHEITHALKLALKARGLTYQDVATHIGVSEQTIKRLFREKDCSLSRLTDVCSAINISLYDLLTVAKEFSEPMVSLSREQEAWLASHPSHFHFLFFLTSGYNTEDIKSKYQLDDLQLFKYLKDLDQQNLLSLGANNELKLRVEGRLLMRLNGKLAKLVRDRNHDFLNQVFKHHDEEHTWFSSSFRFMSVDTLNAMQNDMEELMRRYRKAAYQDEAILPKNKLIPVKWSTIASEFDICGTWPLDTD